MFDYIVGMVSFNILILLDEVYRYEEYVAEKLKSIPVGYLIVRHNGKNLSYYRQKITGEGAAYLGKDKEKVIQELEERDYLRKLQKVLEQRKTVLLKLKKELDNMPSADAVFYDIPEERRHLIQPVSQKKGMSLKEVAAWEKINGEKTLPDGSGKIYLTQKGEKVRSKSEVIIADRLAAAGVPYCYESLLNMTDEFCFNSYNWKPDFKVLNTTTRREYIWEHFGMLDNAKYCASCLFKVETYAEFGYFPGENLIITGESAEHPINLEYVDRLINRYLL